MTHVVLTRAEPDTKRLLDLLSERGFGATALPLLKIEPLAIASAVEAELEHLDVVIFTSANAVTHGLSMFSGLAIGHQLRCWPLAERPENCSLTKA